MAWKFITDENQFDYASKMEVTKVLSENVVKEAASVLYHGQRGSAIQNFINFKKSTHKPLGSHSIYSNPPFSVKDHP